jgi:hypothetical protein
MAWQLCSGEFGTMWTLGTLSPPCSMAQLAYFALNKVFEPHLIAAALLSFKISTIRHATTTAIYSNSFEA